MPSKSPVTLSDVEVKSSRDDRWGQRYLYVECSFCEMTDHLMRVSISYEKQRKGPSFTTVDFQFPDKLYIEMPWRRVPQGRFKRALWRVACLFRRIRLSVAVLLGQTVYLTSGVELNIETAREFGSKLVQAVDDTKEELEREWIEDQKNS